MKETTLAVINQQINEAMRNGGNLKLTVRQLRKSDVVIFKSGNNYPQAIQIIGSNKQNVNIRQIELYHSDAIKQVTQ